MWLEFRKHYYDGEGEAKLQAYLQMGSRATPHMTEQSSIVCLEEWGFALQVNSWLNRWKKRPGAVSQGSHAHNNHGCTWGEEGHNRKHAQQLRRTERVTSARLTTLVWTQAWSSTLHEVLLARGRPRCYSWSKIIMSCNVIEQGMVELFQKYCLMIVHQCYCIVSFSYEIQIKFELCEK